MKKEEEENRGRATISAEDPPHFSIRFKSSHHPLFDHEQQRQRRFNGASPEEDQGRAHFGRAFDPGEG